MSDIILAIDANSLIHRLWHGTNGVGTMEVVRKHVNVAKARIRPSLTIIAFDRRSFRYDLFPSYKSKRHEKDERLKAMLVDAEFELSDLSDFGGLVTADGFEADDTLATCAHISHSVGCRAVLMTGDKDVRQCLRDGRVTQLKGFKTWAGEIRDEIWYTEKDLRNDMGLTPSQYREFQALIGDSGDDIPGCEGVGEKTALACFGVFGCVEEMRYNPAKLPISARLQKRIAEFDFNLMLSLVTLRTDVPIPVFECEPF